MFTNDEEENRNVELIILLGVIGLSLVGGIIRISKLKANISQLHGELSACEKINKELLKENMRQSYIIGKQLEKLKRMFNN